MLSTLERPQTAETPGAVGEADAIAAPAPAPKRLRNRAPTRPAVQRVPRVPKSTLRALRADMVSVGLTVQHAARLLNVNRLTLEALLAGRQHVYSRLGFAAWPERVQALCDEMRESNTILARHLDAAAHEIAAAGLVLPALLGGNGSRTRSARRTAGVASGASTSSTPSARKRAS